MSINIIPETTDVNPDIPKINDLTSLETQGLAYTLRRWDGYSWAELSKLDPITFTDNILIPYVTEVRLHHIQDIRNCINYLKRISANVFGDRYYNTHTFDTVVAGSLYRSFIDGNYTVYDSGNLTIASDGESGAEFDGTAIKLAKVAISGSYSDLLGVVDQANSDWNATEGVSQILNKPLEFLPKVRYSFTVSSSWDCPEGVHSIIIGLVGGGGGGGGNGNGVGGFGGSASFIVFSKIDVVPNQSYVITIGSGGSGNAYAGGNGGNSSISLDGTILSSSNGGIGGYANSFGLDPVPAGQLGGGSGGIGQNVYDAPYLGGRSATPGGASLATNEMILGVNIAAGSGGIQGNGGGGGVGFGAGGGGGFAPGQGGGGGGGILMPEYPTASNGTASGGNGAPGYCIIIY